MFIFIAIISFIFNVFVSIAHCCCQVYNILYLKQITYFNFLAINVFTAVEVEVFPCNLLDYSVVTS